MSEIKERIEKEKIKQVILQFVDILGKLHSLWVPSELFRKVSQEGIHMDGSSVHMVDISKSDLKLVPDLKTFIILPEELFPLKVARVVCDIYEPDSNRLFKFDPRFVLKNVIQKAKKELGNSTGYFASSEIEFFLMKRDEKGGLQLLDKGGYLDSPPTDLGAELRLEIIKNLESMKIQVEKHHHEVPPGKYEFNLKYSDALNMADTIYLVKFIIKLLASKKGLIASFMPKPFHGQYGAGLHTHVSLIDNKNKKNLFYDSSNNYSLSKLAFNFIAGILKHARALTALTNPSVNSYKRLVPGWEAPVYISWARYNRSVLVRIPPGIEMKTRLEYRPTDGSCNFYLAFAGILAAGLDGIKNNLKISEPIEEDIYKMSPEERERKGIEVLPENLGEALKEFSQDEYIKGILGKEFCEKYLELKTKEWKEFCVTVHEWEREKYLDV
ncbi:type I glutamate--ammonia ligase [Candidatus Aminicenantes bacterium AC-335-A11]|jgi:glutamine synthetase|nr:type I glutamate--ammonia ligase [SCandidatus Aminicenantes bacterium Aminicenantia_JdfR_composite]MCP2597458.1 type I glutamate--ammonia ligase [Candidatus Aminicenantes bacterium AC-335-G13]MCP2605842.1 type I glutamate--ammonia ligase [Candidatus Aminicenantes bacterium AC-335-O07]MCP2606387.1 type I glutamate--ammonia ligase [Candidatus Aminicenantes bacterium AC-708-I09]MCP2618877.1 type I glutamate--ammonia ligase [Candidatus Aminicenantes bacterium AC-335-A11]